MATSPTDNTTSDQRAHRRIRRAELFDQPPSTTHADRSGRRAIDASVIDAWAAEYSRTRDKALRDAIVRAHQWLAVVCARKMVRRKEPFDDLVQVGNIGLIKAIDRFDPAFRVSFHTFASATIIGELRRHYRTVWQLRVPRSLQERHALVNTAVDELTNELRRSPTPKEVSTHVRLSVEDVLEALSVGSAMWAGSLSSPEGDGADHHVPTDVVVGDDVADASEERMEVVSLLKTLPPVQRTALFMSFCLEMKQSDIGERLGMTQLQVSRLIRRAVATLRSMNTSELRVNMSG